ncbi:hypothetical protein [Pedobacter alluvionis]|uniref:Aromatic ring-opening dioxygenase LigA n=1 Tax=Pedobacter alluvionis TaxID=475253 RepID=A0A497YAD8_9SPHI|nr:hypothetical protein [Pedobacter alluvionis]RLJ79437.1 hypothetical protein BCL90_0133 [Pedobacter alluvionis]TFB30787.1 hypothetical protein E3V97_09110 [Pedobacter alluvionis]
MEKIKLNFINRSGDTNNSTVVIFQQNVAEDFGEIAIAWQVIKNCGRLDNHPFVYSSNFQVSASDSYGNYTPQLTAYEGQAFDMLKSNSGDILQLSSIPATSSTEVEVRNQLMLGAINAYCYRDGKLLAAKTGLAPGQKAVFEFQPRIYIGVVSQIEEGDVMNSAIISQVNSEINLFGISSADIVMTGGGSGKSSVPFYFTLENINR